MKNLDEKIKLKLHTLIEGVINEAPPGGAIADDLVRFATKYGRKIIDMFGDDAARAMIRNVSDDGIRLFSETLRNPINARGATLYLEGGRNTVLMQEVIDDIQRIASNPNEYDNVVAGWGDLKLADGKTFIRDFFDRRPVRPKPLLKTKTQQAKAAIRNTKRAIRKTKDGRNAFRDGWKTKSGMSTTLKIAFNPLKNAINFFKGRDIEKLKGKDWINLFGWMATGAGDVTQIYKILVTRGVKNRAFYALLNLSGQYARRVWWWTKRLTIIQGLYDIVTDWEADEILYTDVKSSILPRFKRAWTLGGINYVIPWVFVDKEILPIVDVLTGGAGNKRALPKTKLLEKLKQVEKIAVGSLKKLNEYAESEYDKAKVKTDSLKNVSPVKTIDDLIKDPSQVSNTDSLYNAIMQKDSTGVNQQQQNQPPQQPQTNSTVKPKFENPF
jgi:hypothetical protein